MDTPQILPWSKLKQELDAALRWAEATKGRGRQLRKLAQEFFEDGVRTRLHILAANEANELVEIAHLWRRHIGEFPGLLKRIRVSISKGPTLADYEEPGSHGSRARDLYFNYHVGGCLLAAGFDVRCVDAVLRRGVRDLAPSDVVLRWDDKTVRIECKRPQTPAGVAGCLRQAARQIRDRSPGYGIVALDCSRVVRPPETIVRGRSADEAWSRLDRRVRRDIVPIVTAAAHQSILGAFIIARVPAAIEADRSRVLLPSGMPAVTMSRVFSISSWTIWIRIGAALEGFLREAEAKVSLLLRDLAQPGHL